MLLRRSCLVHPDDGELQTLAARLCESPDFRRRWDSLAEGVSDLVFVDQATYSFQHPRLGALQLFAWRTRAVLDDRFIVVYLSPVDTASADALAQLGTAISPSRPIE